MFQGQLLHLGLPYKSVCASIDQRELSSQVARLWQCEVAPLDSSIRSRTSPMSTETTSTSHARASLGQTQSTHDAERVGRSITLPVQTSSKSTLLVNSKTPRKATLRPTLEGQRD